MSMSSPFASLNSSHGSPKWAVIVRSHESPFCQLPRAYHDYPYCLWVNHENAFGFPSTCVIHEIAANVRLIARNPLSGSGSPRSFGSASNGSKWSRRKAANSNDGASSVTSFGASSCRTVCISPGSCVEPKGRQPTSTACDLRSHWADAQTRRMLASLRSPPRPVSLRYCTTGFDG